MDEAEYETVLREAVIEVVRQQAEAGIDIVSDGEFGKSSWAAYVLERITGFELQRERNRPVELAGPGPRALPRLLRGRNADIASPAPPPRSASARSRCGRPQPAPRHRQPQGRASQGVALEEAFITTVAPASTAYNGINEYYPSDQRVRLRHRRCAQAGVPGRLPVRPRSCRWTTPCSPTCTTTWSSESPERYREWAQLRIDALNHALRRHPGGPHSLPHLLR